MMNWFNRLWVIGRRSKRAYLRFYPNPGFMLKIGRKTAKWSRFYGWSYK